MAIGDVNSSARGSGARYNDGKPDLSLIPLTMVARCYTQRFASNDSQQTKLANALMQLGKFQISGNVAFLDRALKLMSFAWRDAARVFEYGRVKYAAWNWAKGMAWSAVVACAGRHALAVFEDHQIDDAESGHTHYGHFVCNLVMLRAFVESYPEGNDLPDPSLFGVDNPQSSLFDGH